MSRCWWARSSRASSGSGPGRRSSATPARWRSCAAASWRPRRGCTPSGRIVPQGHVGCMVKTHGSVRRGKRALCGQPTQLVENLVLGEDIILADSFNLAVVEPMHGFIALNRPLRRGKRPTPQPWIHAAFHTPMLLFHAVSASLHPLSLLPPNGAQRRTGMALLVIAGGHFDLIALLLQPSHVFPVRLSFHARRDRARPQHIHDEFKALVQQCADLRVACGHQGDMGVFLLSCHYGLLVDRESWSLAIVDLP